MCGLPQTSSQAKNQQIISFVNTADVDILALTETNICWNLIPVQHRLHERTRGWWETIHLSIAYFKDDPTKSAFQPSGTALFSINQAAHHVHSSGSDTSGLGRWSWMQYLGCKQVALRIVSAYCPVNNNVGSLSAYNCQRRYLYAKDNNQCPHQAFIDDLGTDIQTWLDVGDQLVIAANINEPVGSSRLTSVFSRFGSS